MQEIESEVSSTSGENALLKKSTDDQLLSPSEFQDQEVYQQADM